MRGVSRLDWVTLGGAVQGEVDRLAEAALADPVQVLLARKETPDDLGIPLRSSPPRKICSIRSGRRACRWHPRSATDQSSPGTYVLIQQDLLFLIQGVQDWGFGGLVRLATGPLARRLRTRLLPVVGPAPIEAFGVTFTQ